MKRSFINVFVGVVLSLIGSLATAGPTDYTCVVLAANKLTVKGTLIPHWAVKSQIGEKFTVDRVTGRILGGPLDNARMEIRLIDKGSNEMSFQVFGQSTQRTHTSHIQVEEFQVGAVKPFLGMTTLYHPGVYTGTCQ